MNVITNSIHDVRSGKTLNFIGTHLNSCVRINTGEVACMTFPCLGEKEYVLHALGKNATWSVHLVNGRNEILRDDAIVGKWTFGPKGYLFAVPKGYDGRRASCS